MKSSLSDKVDTFVAVLVAATMMVVASGPAGMAETHFTKKSPLTIGYSIQSAQDPYWQGYIRGIEHEMKKYGFTKLLTQDSQGIVRPRRKSRCPAALPS